MYESLNLKAWPFQTVPDQEYAKIWAGRKQTKQQLDALLRKMQLVPKSSLHVFWANFGMGKTHTLLHMHYLSELTKGRLIPVYAIMPNKPTSFLDIYREIVVGLPFEYLADQIIKVGGTSPGGVSLNPMFSKSPGVVDALLALRRGEIEASTAAVQWLKAQPGLSARDMHQIGVTYRIKTAEDAIQTLTSLTRLATFRVNPYSRLVILIDEYQRIGELKTNIRNEINAGLHGFFNANPIGLSIMLAFSFGNKDNVAFLLSHELKSRAEPESITLDEFTPGQAVEFLKDLLAQFRLRQEERWAFPFTPQAINTLILFISQKKSLTPRRIMLYANHVLSEHMINYPESLEEINENEVLSYLENPQLGSLDVDNEVGENTT